MTCYLVIGTGRSGTSLTMQALEALGVAVPGEQVPASEDNMRGTGEAIAFRDQCRQLHDVLGHFGGFRPDGWMDEPAAHAARDWMAGFLSEAGAARKSVALKFPLSGLFLPLWQQAAQAAGCRMRTIWATRGAGQVLRSLIAAYDTPPDRAARVWAQRSYYLLRDAPDDTLLLPFEGWAADPAAQVAALAGLTRAPAAARKRAVARFSARLDHSTAEPPPMRAEVQAVTQAVDAMVVGRRGVLGKLVDRDGLPWLEAMTGLGDLLAVLMPRAPFSTESTEMRLRLLAQLGVSGDRSVQVDEELEILSNRIKALAAENRSLREKSADAPPVVTVARADKSAAQAAQAAQVALRERQEALERQAALLKEREAEIARMAAAAEELEGRLQAAQQQLADEAAQAAELRAAYQRLTEQRDRLEEEAEGRYRQRLNLAERRDVNQTKRIEQFIATRDRLNKRVAALEADSKVLKTRREALTTRVGTLEQQVKTLTEQRATLQDRVKVLGETNRETAARNEALRKQVETLRAAARDAAQRPAPVVRPDPATEQRAAALEQELERARLEAADLARRLREAEQANDDMASSRSWRMTQPMRAALGKMRGRQ